MKDRALPPCIDLLAGVCGLGILLSIGVAEAADLARPGTPASVPAFVDWSGGYLGVQASAGASNGAFNFDSATVGGRPVQAFRTGDATGSRDREQNATTAVGGLFGGWTWQTGPWAYGAEADLSAANLKRPLALTTPGFSYEGLDIGGSLLRAKTDLYGSLRARLGYSFERYLVYARFGLAGANARFLATYLDLATAAPSRRARSRAISASCLARASSSPSTRTSRWASTTATSISARAAG